MSFLLPPSPRLQWGVLLAGSIVLALAFSAVHLSAALLLGPMIAAIAVAAAGADLKLPKTASAVAQGVVACLIAGAIPPSIYGEIAANWVVFASALVSVLVASILIGWTLMRFQVLPGTTALWGAFPGAATVMVLMSERYGADMRLVAFMQYLRVVVVALIASAVAHLFQLGGAVVPPLHPALEAGPVAATLSLAVLGSLIGARLPMPAGAMIVPMVAALIATHCGWLKVQLPHPVLAVCYAGVGWTIGLRFTRDILRHALTALPRVLLAIFSLVLTCALFAGALVWFAGIEPLTAYLATSPGGADSVAIIAAGSAVDLPFVMTLQTARFFVVLLFGPMMARALASRAR